MPEPAAPVPSPSPAHQCATRLLCTVHELHRAGYQHVRFSSGMAPSGMYWRCSITHAGNMSDDGLRIIDHSSSEEVASYSTGSQDRYFDWPDAPGRSAKELAALFTERFPQIVRMGKGRDWAYAGWLTEMIGRAERGGPSSLPVFFADYPVDIDRALPASARANARLLADGMGRDALRAPRLDHVQAERKRYDVGPCGEAKQFWNLLHRDLSTCPSRGAPASMGPGEDVERERALDVHRRCSGMRGGGGK